MTNLVEALTFIRNSTPDELRRIIDVVKLKQDINRQAKAMEFGVRDRVSFLDKKGNKIVGIITKFNRKSIMVKVNPYTTWRVAPTLLTLEPEENVPA